MPNQNEDLRVLLRVGARELRQKELDQVSASGPPCRITFSHLPGGGTDEDTQCP
jgi:hypothetical protein